MNSSQVLSKCVDGVIDSVIKGIIKHSKKSPSVFGRYLITMNILSRKERKDVMHVYVDFFLLGFIYANQRVPSQEQFFFFLGGVIYCMYPQLTYNETSYVHTWDKQSIY